MIGMLTGRVESVETDTALIDVGGVGYEVRMSATDLSRLHAGQDTRVFTYMNLSQDAITLHGFLDRDAKKTFLQLIKVSGIGPKVAQSLLSTLTPSAVGPRHRRQRRHRCWPRLRGWVRRAHRRSSSSLRALLI